MTKQSLIAVMIYQLEGLRMGGSPATANTIHSTILSKTDGIANTNSASLYRSFVRFSLIKAGIKKNWPTNWIDLSVDELATKLLS